MKIMVSGIGGVGGYIASVLCAHYEKDVTLVARRKHATALKENGLVVSSNRLGDHTFHPAVTERPADAGIQDMIFICTKTYSLPDALEAVLPCIGPDTLVIPIMNGINHYEVAKEIVSVGTVVNALIYITSKCNEDYSIEQASTYARVFVGGPDQEAASRVEQLLNHPGELDCYVSPDIESELWHKFIVNCGYNTITAYYACTTRGLLDPPSRLEEFKTLLDEAYAVSQAAGANLPADLTERIYHRFRYERSLDLTSSMGRDFMNHRKSELEVFSGVLIQKAHELHVSVPLTERCHQELEKREASWAKQ